MKRVRRWLLPAAILTLLAAVLIGLGLGEGNLAEGWLDFRSAVGSLLHRFGVPGSLALLYLEESGVPLPVPGDVYVTYIGHQAAGSTWLLLAAWAGLIAVVVAGSTNLYLLARRFGPALIEHRLASAFHIDSERIERAHRWFDRWGVLAVIFGRHIPGFRVPITVVAGTLRFPYRLFVPSVAVFTAVWAGAFLLFGARFGTLASQILARYPWIYAAAGALIGLVVLFFALRVVRALRQVPPLRR